MTNIFIIAARFWYFMIAEALGVTRTALYSSLIASAVTPYQRLQPAAWPRRTRFRRRPRHRVPRPRKDPRGHRDPAPAAISEGNAMFSSPYSAFL